MEPIGQASRPRRVARDGFAAFAVAALLLLQLATTRLSWRFDPVTPLLDLPIGLFVGLQVLAGLVYLVIALMPHRDRERRGVLVLIVAGGLLLRAAAWPSRPILEDDFHRYLWDGAASSAGASPYRFAPGQILGGDATVPERLRLEALSGGATVAQINHPALTTIYPPVAQAAFLLAHVIAPFDLDAWKSVLLVADAATAFLLFRLLAALGLPHTLLAVYWWNPLLVKETFNSAHMDVLLLPFLLGALLMRIRRRPFPTAALLALATGVKLWPVLLAPLLLAPWLRRPERRPLVPLAYATLTGLLLLPMLAARWAHSGLAGYTERWEMNDALFAALSWLAGLVPGLAGAAPMLLRVALAAALAALAGIVGARDSGSPAALARGAQVVREPRRCYGSACLAGLDAVRDCDVVVFADADASDDLSEMDRVVAPILTGHAALVIGSRVLGRAEKGALTPQQRFGNALACFLIRLRWRVRFTDLGPFRAVTREALDRLAMADPDYGWTVEMQVKAARSAVAVAEVPVSYRKRIGRSKISGTVRGVLAAGAKILWVIARCAVQPSRSAPAPGASKSPKNSARIARSLAVLMGLFAELPGAQIVLGPLEGERLQGAGSRDALASGQHLLQHGDVGLGVVEVTHGQAERVLDEQRPRRLDQARNAGGERKRDGADAFLVEDALDQSHGLVAHRSSRNQQRQVDMIRGQATRYLPRVLPQRVGLEAVAHEAKVPRRYGADSSRRGEGAEAIERKDDVDVFLGPPRVVAYV